MNWSDVAKVIGTAAPTVGTLLGGPAGAAVGALVATALGTANTPDAVNSILTANPDAMVKLQELQLNAKVQLDQIAASITLATIQADQAQYAAEASDRDSARQLAAKQQNDLVRPAITFVLLLGALAILACIFTGVAQKSLENPVALSTVSMLIALWFGELKQTLGFYFGMTKESQKQNAIVTDFAVAPGTVTKPDK